MVILILILIGLFFTAMATRGVFSGTVAMIQLRSPAVREASRESNPTGFWIYVITYFGAGALFLFAAWSLFSNA